METKKITPAHNDIRKLVEVAHYEDHEKRTESAEFRRVKKELHEEKIGCWIGNGRCEGGLEVHHDHLEYSALSEVNVDKVKAKYPDFTSVDGKTNMQMLCQKHHRGLGFGKHEMSEPVWKLQAFMKEEALDKFELATYTEIFFEKYLKAGHSKEESMKLAKAEAEKKVEGFKK